MSDTPETDAAIISSEGQWSFVIRDTSRRLERERNDLLRRLTELEHSMPIELARLEGIIRAMNAIGEAWADNAAPIPPTTL